MRIRFFLLLVLMLAALPRPALAQTAWRVADEAQCEYRRVDDAALLSEGDVVVVANAAYGYAMGTQQAANNRPGVKVEVRDGCLDLADGVQLLTLEHSSAGWALAVDDGHWLCATSNKSNQLRTTDERGNLMRADISIEAATGHACIRFKGPEAYGMVMRFSHQSRAFCCYPSLTSVDSLQLYRRTRTIASLALPDDGTDLLPLLSQHKGHVARQVCVGRTLVADGAWHTLCLPFALTQADIATTLGQATVEEFCGVKTDADGALVLLFRPVSSTVAGHPYLVKVRQDVAQPVFYDKVVMAPQPVPATLTTADGTAYTFVGTYGPMPLQGTAYRFLSADGTHFAVPNGEGRVGAMRACFVFGQPVASARCRFLSDTSGIALPAVSGTAVRKEGAAPPQGVFSIDGRRLPVPPKHGLVVVKGKKVLLP